MITPAYIEYMFKLWGVMMLLLFVLAYYCDHTGRKYVLDWFGTIIGLLFFAVILAWMLDINLRGRRDRTAFRKQLEYLQDLAKADGINIHIEWKKYR